MAIEPALALFLWERTMAILVEAIEFRGVGPNNPARSGRRDLTSLEKTFAKPAVESCCGHVQSMGEIRQPPFMRFEGIGRE